MFSMKHEVIPSVILACIILETRNLGPEKGLSGLKHLLPSLRTCFQVPGPARGREGPPHAQAHAQ